ncbi:uncharacterized protein Tco025E_06799 [Trypanosoma conorhini]|uniref:Uncharacterized protein n=1 Tax=Trypanosoma conorhini TaxID=83891 RepID=A0A422NZY4_9TRYP|nr:uncharacterized protein Tco025E_06799 [Trypanosoma conorhini]RNF10995.1 hypothetical protein Tco025E_06799 [Trypanosoma conorhini]
MVRRVALTTATFCAHGGSPVVVGWSAGQPPCWRVGVWWAPSGVRRCIRRAELRSPCFALSRCGGPTPGGYSSRLLPRPREGIPPIAVLIFVPVPPSCLLKLVRQPASRRRPGPGEGGRGGI